MTYGVSHILGEFVAAWNAGERPQVAGYLERVAPAERDELAEQLEAFLLTAPEPEYDEATWAQLVSDPVVTYAAAASMEGEPWPSLLPRLRARAGLEIAQVAERLGIAADKRSKAERLLEQMETGALDPERPSRRLLDKLGEILGVPASALDWRRFIPPPPPAAAAAPAPAMYRAAEPMRHRVDLDVLADALTTDAGEWDEVDELFLSGRE